MFLPLGLGPLALVFMLGGLAPYIIYSCAFYSPHMCAGHPLQAGVDIMVITLWLGHEEHPNRRTADFEVDFSLRDQAPAETSSCHPIFSQPPNRQSSLDPHPPPLTHYE